MAFTSHLQEVLRILKDNKAEFCEKVGVLGVGEVVPLVPTDKSPHAPHPGNLKRSITHEVMTGNKGVFIGVTSEAPYAIYVEKGIGQEAQPFLEQGCMNAIPKIKDVAEDLYRRLG